MVLLDRLRGKRDILVPYFHYCRVLRGNRESLLLRQIHGLRYETRYLDAAANGDANDGGHDVDDSDAWAVHALAYDRQQQLAAAVRLTQPPPERDFPFQLQFAHFDAATLPPRAQAAEVSWLVVRKQYRRRDGDSPHGVARDFAERGNLAGILPGAGRARQRSPGPLLLLGLFRELLRHSRADGIHYWYAALEAPLARSLATMGFPFRPIGPEAEAGQPGLYLLDLEDFSTRLRQQNRFLAAWFHDEPIAGWFKLRLLLQALRYRQG